MVELQVPTTKRMLFAEIIPFGFFTETPGLIVRRFDQNLCLLITPHWKVLRS